MNRLLTDPSGSEIIRQADALGQERITAGDTPTVTTSYWRDGRVRTVADAQGNVNQYGYDQRGRLIIMTGPQMEDGSGLRNTRYQYSVDSLLTRVTDPIWTRKTLYSYDAGGRLTQVTQPDPDGSGPLVASTTSTSLDSLGNTVATSDGLGKTTSYDHDAWYRVTASSDPASNVTSTQYDVFGNVTGVTDPLGNQTLFTYNDVNQLVSEGKVTASGEGKGVRHRFGSPRPVRCATGSAWQKFQWRRWLRDPPQCSKSVTPRMI